jgi:hypothetical protein
MVMTNTTLTIGHSDPIRVQDPTLPVPSRIRDLTAMVGGLSNPSKMPGLSYSLPAWRCKVGGSLRSVKGSVCSGCYAMKGCYVFPVVKNALERRFRAIRDERWTAAMIALLRGKRKMRFFRWHDSGDLQSANHLRNIVTIAENVPNVRFWMPTREYRILDTFEGTIPSNLIVRVSAHMIGSDAPSRFSHTSVVLSKGTGSTPGAFTCPASKQGNECYRCRACWSPNARTIAYPVH